MQEDSPVIVTNEIGFHGEEEDDKKQGQIGPEIAPGGSQKVKAGNEQGIQDKVNTQGAEAPEKVVMGFFRNGDADSDVLI